MLAPDRWRAVEDLYHAALARDAEQRATFLEQACGDDDALRREVEALLAHDAAGEFLEPAPVSTGTSGSASSAPSLAARRLGPYLVGEPLGAGGMGEVFRARDTRLKRDVALKLLPDSFASDPERIARFRREAEILAALNHPHIGAIYGVEENDGVRALVLELVEGETLAERIARGALPVDETLRIATQIAEALEAAHDHGIIHRDLKPANIKITPHGEVKVLDFGLAKPLQRSPDARPPEAHPVSPRISTPIVRSTGVILGTAAYMSPEQARGKTVDVRADIWAFGCVLYEMLAGRAPFGGEDPSLTLVAVLTSEPQWSALPSLPAPVARCLRQCLQKDPRERLRHIGDARLSLDSRFDLEPVASSPPRHARTRAPASTVIAFAAVAAVAIGVLSWWLGRATSMPADVSDGAAGTVPIRFEIHAPRDSRILPGPPAVSPDGSALAFIVQNADGTTVVHLRSLDALESRALTGTEGASHVFWAADGRALAFMAASALKRIDVDGGPVRALSSTVGGLWSGSWNRFGDVLFDGATGLMRVPAGGGAPVPVLTRDARWPVSGSPAFLPDGRRYLIRTGAAEDLVQIDLASLDSNETKLLLKDVDSAPVVASTPSGTIYILYLREDALVAHEFDPETEQVRGVPRVIVESIGKVASPPVLPTIGVSPRIMAFQTGGDIAAGDWGWVDRAGAPVGDFTLDVNGINVSLSSDGRYLATDESRGIGRQVWITDLSRQQINWRLVRGMFPVWTPPNTHVLYERGGRIYMTHIDGRAPETPIGELEGRPRSVSPDGRHLLYDTNERTKLLLATFPDGRALGQVGQDGATQGRFSPDGRFFAYTVLSAFEVWIDALPPATGRVKVSRAGGYQPRWSRSGDELFFVSTDRQMMRVRIQRAPTLSAGVPEALFRVDSPAAIVDYAVSSDGQRFLLPRTRSSPADTPITVIVNWSAELAAPQP